MKARFRMFRRKGVYDPIRKLRVVQTLAEHFLEVLEELVGYQASPRGGVVRVRVSGERVLMSGSAITVMRGELLV